VCATCGRLLARRGLTPLRLQPSVDCPVPASRHSVSSGLRLRTRTLSGFDGVAGDPLLAPFVGTVAARVAVRYPSLPGSSDTCPPRGGWEAPRGQLGASPEGRPEVPVGRVLGGRGPTVVGVAREGKGTSPGIEPSSPLLERSFNHYAKSSVIHLNFLRT
jgi:hypothetical protein